MIHFSAEEAAFAQDAVRRFAKRVGLEIIGEQEFSCGFEAQLIAKDFKFLVYLGQLPPYTKNEIVWWIVADQGKADRWSTFTDGKEAVNFVESLIKNPDLFLLLPQRTLEI